MADGELSVNARTGSARGGGARLRGLGGGALLALAWLTGLGASPSPTPSPTLLPSTTTLSRIGDFTQQFTVLATVSGSGPTPTGTVTFKVLTTVIATVKLNAAGRAAIVQAALLPAGEVAVYTATYNGDAHYAPSTSAPLTVGVQLPFPPNVPDPTTTTLTASPTIASFGQTVALTASTASQLGAGPGCGGTTRFQDSSRTLAEVAVDQNGVARLSISTLAVGTHQLTATFLGTTTVCPETNHFLLPSTSAPVRIVIGAPGLPETGRPPTPGPPIGLALAALVALAAVAGGLDRGRRSG